MSKATRKDAKPIGSKHGEAAVKVRATRGDWTARGAVLFWIGVSGVVWIALAVSAVWLY